MNTLTAQIRCQLAHAPIREELQWHIEDQKEACIGEGMSEEEAEAAAVDEMGDPVAIGAELDRIHRPQMPWKMIGLIVMLSIIGVLLQYLITGQMVTQETELIDFRKQILFVLSGFGIMIAVCCYDCSRIVKNAPFWWAVLLITLQNVKKGTLNEAERQQLEQEIERREAISEYLFEVEVPELDQLLESGVEVSSADENREFVGLVNRSIRRAFQKMGITVLLLVLLLGVFLQVGLPQVVSLFYYNPGKDIGENQNQMSLDMKVYTELFLPCRQRYTVNVEDKGYGNYDIYIPQNFSYNRRFTDVSGEISRGKMKLYNSNTLKLPTGNCFVWFQADAGSPLDEMDEQYNMCAAGKKEDSLYFLQGLDEKEVYIGYVSLNEMMEYEEFMNFLDSNELAADWCAVKTYDQGDHDFYRADNIGFQCSLSSSTSFRWDEKVYPELVLWNILDGKEKDFEKLEADIRTESYMRQHFVSMLNYLADQEQFLDMVETNNMDQQLLRKTAEYVSENGITVYGYAAVMRKEEALVLSELDEVYEIYITDLQ